MKTGQLELRGIPQFDSGRWKLRLERVPVHPDNETTMGMDFDSAAQASNDETASSTPVPVRNRVCGRHGFVKYRSSYAWENDMKTDPSAVPSAPVSI